jgi:hypothetical protein
MKFLYKLATSTTYLPGISNYKEEFLSKKVMWMAVEHSQMTLSH